jgi:hypothetical protein
MVEKNKRKNKKAVEFKPWIKNGKPPSSSANGSTVLLSVCPASYLSMENL